MEAISPVLSCPGKSPSSQPLPCPPLFFDHFEMGHNARAGAQLVLGSTEGLDHECSSLRSSAHQLCQGMLPQIRAC